MLNLRRTMKKSLFILVGLTLFAAAVSVTAHNMGVLGEDGENLVKPVRPVKTAIAQPFESAAVRTFPGLVQAAGESDMAFRVGGPLVEFNVLVGERITEGQVLARIDPRDFQINIDRLTASLDEARAMLEAMKNGARPEDVARLESELAAAKVQAMEALKTYQRTKSLWVEKAVPVAELDRARAAYQAVKAQYDAAVQEMNKARRGSRAEDIEATEARIRGLETELRAAQLALNDTSLKAPFTGYVHHKYVENYENVKAGDPIVSLLDFSQVEVRTAIPDSLVIRQSEFLRVTVTMEAYPDHSLEAVIKEVGKQTDTANQAYPMTVVLTDTKGMKLTPGMAGTVRIELAETVMQAKALGIPRTAVFADAKGEASVWLIDPNTMAVRKKTIETGEITGNQVQVVAGLESGNRVVTSGAKFLREGQIVRIAARVRGQNQ